MDPVSIGKYIAALRKGKSLTQEQLGELLCVTNKTVSRWETGVYLPPADILLKMSGLFGVSVNEILSGKSLSAEEYKDAAEKNLAQAIGMSVFSLEERREYFKKKWIRDNAALMILIGLLLIGLLVWGIVKGNFFAVAAVPILLLVAHGWRNNAMMTYVEGKVYD